MMLKTYVRLQKILGCLAITSVIYCLFLLHTTDQESFLFQHSYSMMKLLKWMKERRANGTLVSAYSISNEDRSTNMYQTDYWQAIGDPAMKFQIYAAYFDERLEVIETYDCPIDHICYGSLQLITIFHKDIFQDNIFCNYVYQDGSVDQLKAHRVFRIDDPNEYRTYMIACILQGKIHEELKFPEAVGISYKNHSSMVNATSFTKVKFPKFFDHNSNLEPQKSELLMCVPAFQKNYSNVLRIVEFVEFYKLLGVSKFYFYNESITKDVDKVLRYYMEYENVTVLPWNMDGYSNYDVYYQAISACFNDCFYRASFIDNAKYIALQDIDEVMMPIRDTMTSLQKLLEQIDAQDINSFSFRNVFMLKNGSETLVQPANDTNHNQLYSNRYIKKSEVYPHHIRSKMIGKGKKLVILSNHFYIESVKNTREREMDPSEGLLFHYRVNSGAQTTTEALAAKKYMDTLLMNVNQVCSTNFADGICRTD